jgi:pullulanase
VKNLIALRRAHPGFRFNTWAGVDANVQADQRSASLVYTLINSGANGDKWGKTLLIFNSGADQTVTLPAGNWSVAAEQSTVSTSERVVSGSVVAAGTSITLLHQ